jgi:hypothetical protein
MEENGELGAIVTYTTFNNDPDIIIIIKVTGICWAGHVKRMNAKQMPKRVLKHKAKR